MKKFLFVLLACLSGSSAFAVGHRSCPRPADASARRQANPDSRFAILINDTLQLTGTDEQIACSSSGISFTAVEVPILDSISRSSFRVYSNGKVDFRYIVGTEDTQRRAVCGYTLFPGQPVLQTSADYVGNDGYLINSPPFLQQEMCLSGQPYGGFLPRSEQMARIVSEAAQAFYSGVRYNQNTGQYSYDPAALAHARDIILTLAPLTGRTF